MSSEMGMIGQVVGRWGSFPPKCVATNYQHGINAIFKGPAKLLGHGEVCKPPTYPEIKHQDCDPFSFLTCQNGFCACHNNRTDAKYDKTSGKCVIPIGARCHPQYSHTKTKGCAAGRCDWFTETCTCSRGQVGSPDGMSCSKLIDENCGTDAECGFPKTLLKCLSGKCSCRTSFGHYFDEEAAICRVHIGVTCHPGSKLTCEQEAECVPIPIPRLGKKSWCQFLQFGEDCSRVDYKSLPPISKIRTICDDVAQLECLQGKCACRLVGQKYDVVKKSCVSGLDGDCFIPKAAYNESGITSGSQTTYLGSPCATGLKCVITMEDYFGWRGICDLI
ncbi:hypothetical protein Fcan01_17522 [Folsomia candida]|uniref:EB domain-containing protein n=1 Tax=Folsomia candida TaxID=158441 RepID=A0A226DQ82_FOLCA|nr:hypothetical protein Fcan01_17522 [Folsomia candida]